MPADFGQRSFNVVVHLSGGEQRRLFQGVAARSVDSLLDALEQCIGNGARISYANVFNQFVNSYQPLKQADFPHLPGHLELELGVDWGGANRASDHGASSWTAAGDSGIPFGRTPGIAANLNGASGPSLDVNRNSFKRQIIDRVRSLLIPLYNRKQISADEMAEACTVVVHRFAVERGLDESTLQSHTRDLNLGESDFIRQLTFQFVGENAYDRREHGAADASRVKHRHGATHVRPLASPSLHTANRSEARRHQSATRTTSSTAGSRVKSPPKHAPFGSTSPRPWAGRGSNAPPIGLTESRVRWAQEDRYDFGDDHGFYAKNNSAWERSRAERVSPFRGNRLGGGGGGNSSFNGGGAVGAPPAEPLGADPYAPPHGIVSVSYTVAGSLPTVPQNVHLEGLRAAMAPPAIASGDDDVVVTASVHHVGPATLCWWLAYGPQRIVLNLDKLYSNGLVTTFQVSESGVVLSIKGGTLVPGWTYFIHLDLVEVSSSRHTGAQVEFIVPGGPQGATDALAGMSSSRSAVYHPEIGSTTDLAERREEYVRNKRSATEFGRWHGVGYTADAESGRLKGQVEDMTPKRPPPRDDANRTLQPPSFAIGATATSSNGVGATGSIGQRRPVLADAASSPTMPSSLRVGGASSPAPPGSPSGSTVMNASGYPSTNSTFQQSLRVFFEEQVEPLYHLSANPSLTEQQFKYAVRTVAKDYWFAHSANETLTEDLKRAIVSDVKAALAKVRANR